VYLINALKGLVPDRKEDIIRRLKRQVSYYLNRNASLEQQLALLERQVSLLEQDNRALRQNLDNNRHQIELPRLGD
jgi:prefoldin subunit 5